jgi:ribA/ribD-fused uncharacterized protein
VASTASADPIYFQRKGYEEFRFLSNAWPSCFDHWGATYPTVEHYYQAMKCAWFEEAEAVRASPSPQAARLRGQYVEIIPGWDGMREQVMYVGLVHKFAQSRDLRERLLATGGRELVEYAPYGDTFWGVDRELRGENRLGRLLMRAREWLR